MTQKPKKRKNVDYVSRKLYEKYLRSVWAGYRPSSEVRNLWFFENTAREKCVSARRLDTEFVSRSKSAECDYRSETQNVKNYIKTKKKSQKSQKWLGVKAVQK